MKKKLLLLGNNKRLITDFFMQMDFYFTCASTSITYAGEKVSGHCPSVDVLFTSTAETAGRKSISALMTGMGADGAKGLLKLKNSGGYTIGQDKESCIVYGMPMEAYKLGACCEQQSLANIGVTICKRLNDGW